LAEILPPRPKARVRAVPIFAKLDKMQLHRIVSASVSTTYRAGDTVVTQGDMGDAMYIIERGRCDVIVNGTVVHKLSDGDSFGELSLLSDEARSASIVATGEVLCMVLTAPLVGPILEQCWGSKGELERRERILRRVPIFGPLARGELRRLATQLERVHFPDGGFEIVTEGDVGRDMYVVAEGNCEAFTEEHGRVKEYCAGEFFGELGVVGGSTAVRQATVRTVVSKVSNKTTVECLRLMQKDVARILSGDVGSIRDAMSNSVDEYRKAENLKVSDVVAKPLRRFWSVIIAESDLLRRQRGEAAEGHVTREG
jgi:CRP-like cAMP-binding protein